MQLLAPAFPALPPLPGSSQPAQQIVYDVTSLVWNESDTVLISFSFIIRCVAILTVLDKDHSFLSSRTVQVTDTFTLFMTNQKI